MNTKYNIDDEVYAIKIIKQENLGKQSVYLQTTYGTDLIVPIKGRVIHISIKPPLESSKTYYDIIHYDSEEKHNILSIFEEEFLFKNKKNMVEFLDRMLKNINNSFTKQLDDIK